MDDPPRERTNALTESLQTPSRHLNLNTDRSRAQQPLSGVSLLYLLSEFFHRFERVPLGTARGL